MKHDNVPDTRSRILEAAVDEFSEKGKYGARMQAIADRAGINKAMIHYYFTDKETLYESVFQFFFSDLFGKFSAIIDEQQSFENKLERLIAAYIDMLSANERIVRLMQREFADKGKTVKKAIRKLSQSGSVFFPEVIRELIDQAKADGVVRNVDTVQTLISIVGMSVLFFVGRPIIETIWDIKPENQREFLEARKKSIVDMILNGLLVSER